MLNECNKKCGDVVFSSKELKHEFARITERRHGSIKGVVALTANHVPIIFG